ncbi:MAG: hypothetical protein ACKOYH_07670, partial [Cyanobium sp.]
GLAAITVMAGATPSQAQFSGCGTPAASGSIFGPGGFLEFINTNGSCAIGDKTYSDFNTAQWGNFPIDATINIAESGSEGLTHTITLSSSNGFNSAGGPAQYDFDYKIAVTSSQYLEWWRPASTSSLGNPDYSVDTTATNPTITVSRDEFSGLSPQNFFNPNTTESFFTNTIIATADGPNAITQTVNQVPGPLPILGVGAAFGFSRKLRARIKNAG